MIFFSNTVYKLRISAVYGYDEKYQRVYVKLIQPLSHIRVGYIKHLMHLPATLFTRAF